MEQLSQEEAADLKAEFQSTMSPELQRVLGGIGLCVVNADPLSYGIAVRLKEDIDREVVYAHFSRSLRDNINIRISGRISH